MIAASKVSEQSLNRLNCEWSDYIDMRLNSIKKQYYSNENTGECYKSNAF